MERSELRIFTEFKQPNDWSCGVYALRYLLFLKGLPLEPTEADLATTESDGTSHSAIRDYLFRHAVGHTECMGTPLGEIPKPCLVNYQYYRDGHYGVAVKQTGKRVYVFNPWTARIDAYKIKDFENRWFSTRYGAKWALALTMMDD